MLFTVSLLSIIVIFATNVPIITSKYLFISCMHGQSVSSKHTAAALLMTLLLLGGCCRLNPSSRLDEDAKPPIILGIIPTSSHSLQLHADEELVALGPFTLEPALGAISCKKSPADTCLRIETSEAMRLGTCYTLKGAVCDDAGNSCSFEASFSGYNDHPASLLINEFTPRGSRTRPDRVELLVTESGNTAGLVLYDGIEQEYRQRFVFPDMEVSAGSLLVVCCGPSDEDYELSTETCSGLSGNNGVITIYRSIGSQIMDAVVYSDRFSDSDSRYMGFGSRYLLEAVTYLIDSGHWKGSLRPEEAARSDDSTSTRSICRSVPYRDTDTGADFHTVPTRGSTYGSENSNLMFDR